MTPRKPSFPVKLDNEPFCPADASTKVSSGDADRLIRSAHRVLVHYLPGTPLPSDLFKVRAMLDAHMFGRDKRIQRDDVVRIARQIDSWRASTPAQLTPAPHLSRSK